MAFNFGALRLCFSEYRLNPTPYKSPVTWKASSQVVKVGSPVFVFVFYTLEFDSVS